MYIHVRVCIIHNIDIHVYSTNLSIRESVDAYCVIHFKTSKMYYAIGASVSSLHRESTDSLISTTVYSVLSDNNYIYSMCLSYT